MKPINNDISCVAGHSFMPQSMIYLLYCEIRSGSGPPYHSQNTLVSYTATCSSRYPFTHNSSLCCCCIWHINRTLDECVALFLLGLDELLNVSIVSSMNNMIRNDVKMPCKCFIPIAYMNLMYVWPWLWPWPLWPPHCINFLIGWKDQLSYFLIVTLTYDLDLLLPWALILTYVHMQGTKSFNIHCS